MSEYFAEQQIDPTQKQLEEESQKDSPLLVTARWQPEEQRLQGQRLQAAV